MHGFITDIQYKQRKKSLKQASSMIEASNMGNIIVVFFVLNVFNFVSLF